MSKLLIVFTAFGISATSPHFLLFCQTKPQRTAAEAMRESIEKQKASIRRQVGDTGPADSFFTTPWANATPAVSTSAVSTSAAPSAPAPDCDPLPEETIKSLTESAAKSNGLKVELVRAVAHRESAFYPCAVSAKGAIGLMQLMPATAETYRVDPLNPKQNVDAGAKYLKSLVDKYKGDVKLSLAAYNAGPGRVDAAGKVPDIPETVNYVDAVMQEAGISK